MEILIAVSVLGGAALLLGFLLSLASKIFAVKTDEKEASIREALPGANCGACGFAGCDSYAKAVSDGSSKPSLCIPGGKDTAAKIGKILGVAVEVKEKRAVVLCNGTCDKAQTKYEHSGKPSCAAAALVQGGPKACNFGCMGFGDCALVCDYNAITITDGIAHIDHSLCIGCGKCVNICPKHIIKVFDLPIKATVMCLNKDKGAIARKLCSVSCIGCGLCKKNCPNDAITLSDNLAIIDPVKCTACGKCISVCPQKTIK